MKGGSCYEVGTTLYSNQKCQTIPSSNIGIPVLISRCNTDEVSYVNTSFAKGFCSAYDVDKDPIMWTVIAMSYGFPLFAVICLCCLGLILKNTNRQQEISNENSLNEPLALDDIDNNAIMRRDIPQPRLR